MIQDKYWLQLESKLKALAGVRLGRVEWSVISRNVDNGACSIALVNPIHFRQVRYRTSGTKDRFLDIRLSGTLDIVKDPDVKIKHYITQVAYYDRKQDLISPVLEQIDGFHFDYDSPPEVAHPVFHAQHKPTVLKDYPISGIETLSETTTRAIRSARIPSAQLDFVSSIMMVAADYFVSADNHDKFISLLNWVDSNLVPNIIKSENKNWARLKNWYFCE
ncbi:MAG: hypothetical protein AB2692_23695 [Candidatus Thiodiazotropha sp.]